MGCCFDAKDIHFNAFSEACKQHGLLVKRDYHDIHLDGLPTVRKLEKLGVTEPRVVKIINDAKQQISSVIFNELTHDKELIELLAFLTESGYTLSVGSNATRNTVAIALKRLGIDEFFSCAYGNDDVKECKPSPEVYYKCMTYNRLWVPETMVVEDTEIGLMACRKAGLSCLLVQSRKDVTKENILGSIPTFEDVFV